MKALEDALERIGEDKVKYKTGQSDEKIAETIGVSVHAVIRARLDVFGKVPLGAPPGTGGPLGQLVERVKGLERRLEALEDYHTRTMKSEHERQQKARSLADLGAMIAKANG